jgi:hypothetical protein
MVVGREFVWAHLPKAAGDTTLSLFGLFPELVISADSATRREKHALFTQRSDQVSGKRRVMNIRRLPHWLLSYTMFKTKRGLAPHHTPLPMDSPRQMAESIAADRNLVNYLDRGPRTIDIWLRVERLAEDFLAFVEELTDVDADRRRLVLARPRENERPYDRELSHWFSDDFVVRMYESNPLWAWIEREVYGDTLADESYSGGLATTTSADFPINARPTRATALSSGP